MKPNKYPQEWLLTVIGGIGAILLPIGSFLNFGGVNIPIAAIGMILPGSVVLIVGSIMMVGALVLDSRLSAKRSREDVIRDTLWPESKD